jgi:hypothetical protein
LPKFLKMSGASLSVVERVCKMKANISSPINTFRRSIKALTAAERPRQCSLEYAKAKLVRTRRNNHLEERRAPPCDALYSDGIVGHRSCDRIVFDPSAAAPGKSVATCPTGRSFTSFPAAARRSRRAPACR